MKYEQTEAERKETINFMEEGFMMLDEFYEQNGQTEKSQALKKKLGYLIEASDSKKAKKSKKEQDELLRALYSDMIKLSSNDNLKPFDNGSGKGL